MGPEKALKPSPTGSERGGENYAQKKDPNWPKEAPQRPLSWPQNRPQIGPGPFHFFQDPLRDRLVHSRGLRGVRDLPRDAPGTPPGASREPPGSPPGPPRGHPGRLRDPPGAFWDPLPRILRHRKFPKKPVPIFGVAFRVGGGPEGHRIFSEFSPPNFSIPLETQSHTYFLAAGPCGIDSPCRETPRVLSSARFVARVPNKQKKEYN